MPFSYSNIYSSMILIRGLRHISPLNTANSLISYMVLVLLVNMDSLFLMLLIHLPIPNSLSHVQQLDQHQRDTVGPKIPGWFRYVFIWPVLDTSRIPILYIFIGGLKGTIFPWLCGGLHQENQIHPIKRWKYCSVSILIHLKCKSGACAWDYTHVDLSMQTVDIC